jgi:hypothetical protein
MPTLQENIFNTLNTALSVGLPLALDKPGAVQTPAQAESKQYSETAPPSGSVKNISGTPTDNNYVVAGMPLNKTAVQVAVVGILGLILVKMLRG